MSLRFVLLLLCLLLPSWTMAQPMPMPRSADPHMTGYDQSGSFTVAFYGTRPDGTLCPPSVNAFSISINDGERITGLHSLSLSKDTDPALAALFEGGSCHIAFEGTAAIRTHHGTNASITPVLAHPKDSTPAFTGRFTLRYAPVMCLVLPCPPGSYTISDDSGQLLGRVNAILIDEVETGTKSILRGRYPDWSAAEGSVWFDTTTMAEMLQFEAGERRARIHLTYIVQETVP